MRNMAVIREKAEKFQETEEFADIINAIGERSGVPMHICVSEICVTCKGDSHTADQEKITEISFQELGYRDLCVQMTKDNKTYNEVCLVAFSIFDFFKKQVKEQGIPYSFTFPVAKDILTFPSNDESKWSLFIHREQGKGEKSWVTYAVLGFFLGAYGVHNFYAKQTKKGLIKLLVTCTIIGSPFMALWAMYEAYQAYTYKSIPEV